MFCRELAARWPRAGPSRLRFFGSDRLVKARAELGASLNRLDFAAANIAATVENSEAARSAPLDLDMASEMIVATSRKVLVQVGVSMSVQGNMRQRDLLNLLQ